MRFQTLYEARWILGIVLLLTANLYFLFPWLGLFGLLVIFCVLCFFRDPDRQVPADPNAVVAAADGVVADIGQVDETEVLKAKTQRVGIFLSVFDVHTNRAPIEGKITYSKLTEGDFFDARSPEASTRNESRTWAFQGSRATLVVRQITGAIARRIVDWSKVGDTVRKGERFGMIRFGSRTEVYLPLNSTVMVKVGDRVRGGATVIAVLSSN
ncbi:MAG TPA: phosphatidylserine decarboxylase family protein [Chthoniobacteraceae bacterium]|nr:phosphatidylserine decarboxylase family protein [Chthoniobacteraceae bacterium]